MRQRIRAIELEDLEMILSLADDAEEKYMEDVMLEEVELLM